MSALGNDTGVRLAAAEIADPHEGIEIGLGDALLLKAVGEATGSSDKELKKALTAIGDLGIVAKNARSKQRTMFAQKSLTAKQVRFQLCGHSLDRKLGACFISLFSNTNNDKPGAICSGILSLSRDCTN